MTLTLSLTAPDLDEEDLQALTREVALVGGGGVGVALIGVLKAYFERSKSLDCD
jgi:hypothetical protein